MQYATYTVSDETRDALEAARNNFCDYTDYIIRPPGQEAPTTALPAPQMRKEMFDTFESAIRLSDDGEEILQALRDYRDHTGAPAVLLKNLTTRPSAHSTLEMFRQFMLEGKEDIRQRKHDVINDQLSTDPSDLRVKPTGFTRIHFDPHDFSALTCIEKGNNPRPTLFYDVDNWLEGLTDEYLALDGSEASAHEHVELKESIARCMLEGHWMSPKGGIGKQQPEPLIMANPDYDASKPLSQPFLFCKKDPFDTPIDLAEESAGPVTADQSEMAQKITKAWLKLQSKRNTEFGTALQLENGDFICYSNHALMHGGGDKSIADESFLAEADLPEKFRTRHLAGVDVDVYGHSRMQPRVNVEAGVNRLEHLGCVGESAYGIAAE